MSNQVSYERQRGNGKSKSWSLRFFLFAINMLLFFLLLQISFLLTAGLYLLGLSLLILVINYAKRRRSSTKSRDSIKDLFPLLRKYIRINRRYVLASILGLSLAILVFSQIVLLTNGDSTNFYSQALDHGQTPVFSIHTFRDDPNYYSSTNLTALKPQIVDTFQKAASDVDLVAKEVIVTQSYQMSLNLSIGTHQDYQFVQSGAISKTQFDFLKTFPGFPNVQWRDNLTILAVPDYFIYDSSAMTFLQQSLPNLRFTTDNGDTFTGHVDALWFQTNQDRNYGWNNDLSDLYYRVEGRLLMSEAHVHSYFSHMNVTFTGDQYASGYLDIKSLEGLDAQEAIAKLSYIRDEIQNLMFKVGSGGTWVQSDAFYRLQDASLNNAAIVLALLIVSIPMLSVAMYLVYFSLNLVELRKQNLVAIMKVRGISSGQLQFMMVIESIISSLISSGIGMLLSIPVTQYVINKSKIYGVGSTLSIPFSWYWMIPVIGIILALDLNIGQILSITSTLVEEGENPEETKEPFWRRLYLDVIFTILGVVVWIVVRYIPVSQSIYEFLIVIGVWSLFFFAIGLPLLVSRYYASFLTVISDFLWVREGNLFALATRNMRNNKFSASKLAVLLIIGMMFSFVALSVPYSFNTAQVEQVQYNIGSDFNVSGLNSTNTTQFQIFNISEITHTSSYQIYAINSASRVYSEVRIMGVDPNTFADTAFWKDNYSPQKLSVLMKALKEGKSLIESQALSVLNKEVGDSIVINTASTSFPLDIGGTFDFWPILYQYNYFYNNQIQIVHIVMPLDKLMTYSATPIVNVLAKTQAGANATKVQEQLQKNIDDSHMTSTINSLDASLTSYYDDPTTQLTFALFDTLLLITVLTTIIGVGYFSFTTLAERRREIGVFRAVGMVSRQIFSLLLVESVVLVASSIFIGILAGSFISSNFFYVIGGLGGSVPPILLRYPTLETFSYVGGTLIIGIIAAAIPARSTSSKQTGSILRAD